MQPLVSIIMPVFNRLQLLGAAVESVLGQSFSDWELLIADDGSDRETQEYLHTLEGIPRVRVLRLAHTGNPAAVRNAGLRAATGEYVAFLDSDDLWAPEKLRLQIESLRVHEGCEWGYTGFSLVDASGSPLTRAQPGRPPPTAGRILDRLVNEEALVVTPSVVARRELLARVGGYDETLRVCEDYELWVRLASCSEADFIDQPLVQVRRHGEHSFDDVTCLENLLLAIELVRRSGAVAHLDAVLRRRRAAICSRLAHAHALRKSPLRVLATLGASARYSWRYPNWWTAAMAATIRGFAPELALRIVRNYRRGRAPARRSPDMSPP